MEFTTINESTDSNIKISCNTEKCCICLEDCNENSLLKTKCEHYFHSECLFMWIIQDRNQRELLEFYDDVVPLKGKCPLCRCKISQIFDLTEHKNYKPKYRFKGIFDLTKDYIKQKLYQNCSIKNR